jgi:thiamine biosynthesis lipoprotein
LTWAFGIPSACSNLGGNVVTRGTKPDGSPWQVGIQHPRQENRLIGSVSVVGQSVVTSGDYQRYFIDRQGKRRHHILNPTTGYPAESGWVSVSVITETSLTADALSTLLFVAGKEKSLEYLSHFPAAEAVFIDADLQIFITQGLKNRFQADQGSKITIFS